MPLPLCDHDECGPTGCRRAEQTVPSESFASVCDRCGWPAKENKVIVGGDACWNFKRKRRNQMDELTQAYKSLGRMAEIGDTICQWAKTQGELPEYVEAAVSEMSDYIEHVRP